MLVDAMTVRMVNKPESLDTIVATNRKQMRASSNAGLGYDVLTLYCDSPC
jgi:hypothetical protein